MLKISFSSGLSVLSASLREIYMGCYWEEMGKNRGRALGGMGSFSRKGAQRASPVKIHLLS